MNETASRGTGFTGPDREEGARIQIIQMITKHDVKPTLDEVKCPHETRRTSGTKSTNFSSQLSLQITFAFLASEESNSSIQNGGKYMTRYERAAQLWSILALAAKNRQILTYDIVAKLSGVPRPAIGGFLEPIQTFCMKKNLPPLTILVVSEDTGLPSPGFIAAADIPRTQQTVFAYDWLGFGAPAPDNIESVCTG